MKGNYKAGLVLEGGGTRAIFTSGVLDAFIENNIEFDYVIGVSAGSCNGASFIAKNFRRQHDITVNYCNDKRYMSFKSFIKNGEYVNLNWDFGALSYDIMPLDNDTFEKSGCTFCVVATNGLTGKAEYFYPKSLREYGCPQLKASCALPLATKGVEIGGITYFDGGVTDSIPLKKAIDDGCQKAVVIMTQDEHYIKKPITLTHSVKFALRKYPVLAKAVLNRSEIYNKQKEYVFEQQKKGNCFVIEPAVDLHCTAVEKDKIKLERIYQLGYQQGKRSIEAVKEFLKD